MVLFFYDDYGCIAADMWLVISTMFNTSSFVDLHNALEGFATPASLVQLLPSSCMCGVLFFRALLTLSRFPPHVQPMFNDSVSQWPELPDPRL